MNPRSDRRPPSRGGRGEGRPGPRFSPRGPSRWRRPEGAGGWDRRAEDGGAGPRDGGEARGPRPDSRGVRPDGRGPRPDSWSREPRGPRGGGRFESRGSGPRPEGRAGAGRPERRGDRPWSGPAGGAARAGGGWSSDRPERRPPLGERGSDRRRPPFAGDGPRFERRSFRREERPSGPPPPIVVAAGEADVHGDAPAADLVWGRHTALAVLESGRPVHRIWCTPEMRFSPKFLQLLREAKAGGVLVEEVTWARLGQITGGAVHQGIVLQTAAAETLDLPTLIDGCRALEE
ncbi:MAG: RNA methyltransferase substrate-binding domain-containing protein, partial [Cyanobacteriota bacterium]|nr:RNA methyltransferase substrate-binding domain-containing protein [Cyanobacteriota bacterium]